MTRIGFHSISGSTQTRMRTSRPSLLLAPWCWQAPLLRPRPPVPVSRPRGRVAPSNALKPSTTTVGTLGRGSAHGSGGLIRRTCFTCLLAVEDLEPRGCGECREHHQHHERRVQVLPNSAARQPGSGEDQPYFTAWHHADADWPPSYAALIDGETRHE